METVARTNVSVGTNTKNNTQVVERAFGYFGEGNIPALLTELTDDVKWTVPGPTDILPWTGVRTGKQQVAEFFKLIGENVEFGKFEPREFVEQGNKVVALGVWETKAKTTGKTANGDWAMAFTFRDGKVCEFREYNDTYTGAEAFRK